MAKKNEPDSKAKKTDDEEWRGKDGRRRYDVEPKKFIEVWETSTSAEEVATKLGMPKAIVHARATTYREKGIKLKSMPRRGRNKPLDVQGLNALIDNLRGAKGDAGEDAASAASDEAAMTKLVDAVIARLQTIGVVPPASQGK